MLPWSCIGLVRVLMDGCAVQRMGSVALCMQCDVRKVMVGNLDRTITYVVALPSQT